MSEPWKTDRWFVSPWNYLPEVTAGLNFKKQIKIHDVTLRDGEQQAGLVFSKDQKVALAEKLAEMGVHRIEAGMPAVSASDAAAVTEIVKRNLPAEIFAFCRCMKDDVARAVDCGVKNIVIEIPSSEHLIREAYRWPLEKAVELSIEATQFAKENGLYTVYFPIDASRADINWFLDLIEKISTEGHMDALVLVDTFGGISPHAVPWLVRKVKERIAKPIEVHFHDDFGMGAANTLMALAAGADVAHTTVAGTGERAGNAPYEPLVLSLLTMYGVDLGIKTEKMYPLAKYLREIAHMPLRPNHPIIGDTIGQIESGIVAGWYENCGLELPTEIAPFRADLVGQNRTEVVLGKNSGVPNINLALAALGRTATEEEKRGLVERVKAKSFEKGGLLSLEEFADLL
ncbi:LeuA family protein [Gelria sp. Kuro-4]|uniref:LeuA family protein n=1 Tax=Gelria sp. Kuro-4 TaxID=2796927 RepID=UPI001BEDA05A|nr:hypothetical protein [Gelria sp. Kuro-4]BCV23238.1 3-hydroxy-3-methylglutaryl-CoA lyase [Gelria sp. Kuro-4]